MSHVFHFKNAEGVVVGCGHPGFRMDWRPVRPLKGGFIAKRDGNYAGSVPETDLGENTEFCDDTIFFYLFYDFCQHIDVSNKACGGVW